MGLLQVEIFLIVIPFPQPNCYLQDELKLLRGKVIRPAIGQGKRAQLRGKKWTSFEYHLFAYSLPSLRIVILFEEIFYCETLFVFVQNRSRQHFRWNLASCKTVRFFGMFDRSSYVYSAAHVDVVQTCSSCKHASSRRNTVGGWISIRQDAGEGYLGNPCDVEQPGFTWACFNPRTGLHHFYIKGFGRLSRTRGPLTRGQSVTSTRSGFLICDNCWAAK